MLSEKSTSPFFVEYTLEYERIIGEDVYSPKFRDVKFNVYIEDEDLSVYFWIDYLKKTIEITSGTFHDEPLPKEVVDMIVEELNLKEFMIKWNFIFECFTNGFANAKCVILIQELGPQCSLAAVLVASTQKGFGFDSMPGSDFFKIISSKVPIKSGQFPGKVKCGGV